MDPEDELAPEDRQAYLFWLEEQYEKSIEAFELEAF